MTTDEGRRVARGFDRLAPFYDALAACYACGAIGRSRRALVDELPAGGRYLVLGDGTGHGVAELLRARRPREVVCLDSSERMLARLRARVDRLPEARAVPVRLLHGDVCRLAGERPFDVVVSHFFLDLFTAERLAAVLDAVDRCWSRGGVWCVTDFAPPHGPAGRALLRGLYAFFGVTCRLEAGRLPDIRAAFERIDACLVRERRFAAGTLESLLFHRAAQIAADSRG